MPRLSLTTIAYAGFSLGAVLVAPPARADGAFETFDGPGAFDTRPAVIDLLRRSVGTFSYDRETLASHAFLRTSAGKIVIVDPPKTKLLAQATGIDAAGNVLGWHFYTMGGFYRAHGFRRSAQGKFTIIGTNDPGDTYISATTTLGAYSGYYCYQRECTSYLSTPDDRHTYFAAPGGAWAVVANMNVANTVIGSYTTTDSAGTLTYHGFIRTADGGFTTLDLGDPTAAEPYTAASGINSLGVVVGDDADAAGRHHGYLRTRAGAVTRFDVPGAFDTFPRKINDLGVVVGFYTASQLGAVQGFLRRKDGSISTFAVPGSQQSFPSDINARGDVIGDYMTYVNGVTVTRGFIYHAGVAASAPRD